MNTKEMIDKFSNDKVHAQEVNRLSLLIFDGVNNCLKEMSDKERKYLESAALLHDIGYFVSSEHHNKHSQKLILDYGLDDYKESEKQMISCICRYHRGSLPDKKEHEIYCKLDKKERKIVKRLGGILRIADSLDSNHVKLIDDIKLSYDEINNITEIILTPSNFDYLPEINYSKKDLFESAFKTQVVFKFAHNIIL